MLSNNTNDLSSYRLHKRFGFIMSKLNNQMQARLESGLEEHGITRVQWVALTSIEIEGKRSPSDLAEHIGVSRPAISRMLKLMESSEFIERSPIGDDGRTRQLSVTDKGREALNSCWPHVYATEQYFLGKLTADEQTALGQALHSLMDGESEELDEF